MIAVEIAKGYCFAILLETPAQGCTEHAVCEFPVCNRPSTADIIQNVIFVVEHIGVGKIEEVVPFPYAEASR